MLFLSVSDTQIKILVFDLVPQFLKLNKLLFIEISQMHNILCWTIEYLLLIAYMLIIKQYCTSLQTRPAKIRYKNDRIAILKFGKVVQDLWCSILHELYFFNFNPLNANPTKWSNTFVSKLPMNCLSAFDRFVGLALSRAEFVRVSM